MKRTWGVLIAIVAALGVMAPAASAGGWLPSVDLAPGDTGAVSRGPSIATSRGGGTVVAWVQVVGAHRVLRAVVRPAGGSFSAPQTLSDPTVDVMVASYTAAAVAIDAQGNATVVWLTAGGVVHAAYHPNGGTWSAAQDLSSTGATNFSVAAGVDGGAIAVWARVVPGGVQAEGAIRSNGASLFASASAISAVGNDVYGAPRATMDPAGDVAVIWQRAYNPGGGLVYVEEASAKAAGQVFPTGAPGLVSLSSTSVTNPAGADSATFDIKMTPDGRVLAMWDYSDGTNVRVYSRDRTISGTFASSTWDTLSTPAGPNGTEGPLLALDDAGGAAAAWRDDNATDTIRGALRPSLGAFSDTGLSTTISDQQAIAGSPAGDVIAVWVSAPSSVGRIVASRRAPGGGFGGPVELDSADSTATPAAYVSAPNVGVDDQGNAYVSYLRQTGTAWALKLATYDNAPPVLGGVSAPASLVAGQPGTFATSATDRASATTIHWDFGDGRSADGASVAHAFGAAGSFTVTATATDAAGNATSATRTVAVTPVPAPAGGTTPPPVIPGIPTRKPVPAKVAAKWLHLSRGRTAVKALSLTGVKVGDTIKLSCSGGGCAPLKKAKSVKPKKVKKATVSLLTYLKALKLSPKAKLTITVSRKGYKSIVITYTMVKGKDPKRTLR